MLELVPVRLALPVRSVLELEAELVPLRDVRAVRSMPVLVLMLMSDPAPLLAFMSLPAAMPIANMLPKNAAG